MITNINTTGPDARHKLAKGIQALTDMVASTLGPAGKTVIIRKKSGTNIITKDGVTVAKAFELSDPVENLGVQLVKEVASKTALESGDGTTTATVIANAILSEGIKIIDQDLGGDKLNVNRLRKHINSITNAVISKLTDIAIPVTIESDYLRQVAKISGNNNDSIGDLIYQAIQLVGKDGAITVQESSATETELIAVEGLEFDKGFTSSYFITNNDKLTADWEDALIFIVHDRITSAEQIIPVLEYAVNKGKPLLIIADDIDSEPMATLVVNRLKAGLKVCASKSPGFGDGRRELLSDIAALTGGTVIGASHGMSMADLSTKFGTVDLGEILGKADRFVASKDNTVIIGGKGDPEVITARIESIKSVIKTTESDFDKDKLYTRLAKMTGGVAIIKVGGNSELEVKELKDRIDDALGATKAAMVEGIIPGGGISLALAIRAVLKDMGWYDGSNMGGVEEAIAMRIMLNALTQPFILLSVNSSKFISDQTAEEWLDNQVLTDSNSMIGYDALGDELVNMLDHGIIDPLKVTRTALLNAESIAALIISTSGSMIQLEDKSSNINTPEYL